jgi:hypothetical protein
MKKVFAAILIASVALSTQVKADGGADYSGYENYREEVGHRGSGAGVAIAAGVLGIIAGAMNRPRYYGGPVYGGYYDGPYEHGPYVDNPYNNPYYRRGYPGYPGPYVGPYPRYPRGGYGYGYGRRDYGRPGYGYQGRRDYGRPGYGR